MNSLILENLPSDLFSAGRLPARGNDGFTHHPDLELIYLLVGVDDEGEAADKLIKEMGYKAWNVWMEYDNPELHDRYGEIGESDCSSWTPSVPDGEGWLLICITDTEDGPVACYVRLTLLANEVKADSIEVSQQNQEVT